MNIPRRQPLHTRLNFGIPPQPDDDDGAPYVIVWIAGGLVFWIAVFAVAVVRHWL